MHSPSFPSEISDAAPEFGLPTSPENSAAGSTLRNAWNAVAALTPASEAWARAMDDLAQAWLRWNPGRASQTISSTISGLDHAIRVRRKALRDLDPKASPEVRGWLLCNLSVDLATYFRRTREITYLEEAISNEEALSRRAAPQVRLTAASNLVVHRVLWGEATGEEVGTSELREQLLAAITAYAPSGKERGAAVENSLALLLDHWVHQGRPGELDGLVGQAETFLDFLNLSIDDLPSSNLTGLLLEHAEEKRDERLLEQVERSVRAHLTREDLSDKTRASHLHVLVSALRTIFDWTGQAASLKEASRHADTLVELVSGTLSSCSALSLRGIVHLTRFTELDDREALEQALSDTREAVDLAERHGLEPSEYVGTLCAVLNARFDLHGDSRDLNEAINRCEAVLRTELAPIKNQAALNSNLAQTHLSRSTIASDGDELEQALHHIERSISQTDERSEDLAGRYNSTATILTAFAYRDRAPALLDQAIDYAVKAREASFPNSTERRLYLLSEANLYHERWSEFDGSARDLDQAIDLAGQAHELTSTSGVIDATISHTLGCHLSDRYEYALDHEENPSFDDLEKAVELWNEALNSEFPHIVVKAGVRLGDVAFAHEEWEQAELALGYAMDAARELTTIRSVRSDKELARSGVQGIGALAALCAYRNGDLRRAVEHLERGTATLLAETLAHGHVENSAPMEVEPGGFDDVVEVARRTGRTLVYVCASAVGFYLTVDPDGQVDGGELPESTYGAVIEKTSLPRRRFSWAAALTEEQAREVDWFDHCDSAIRDLLSWTDTAVSGTLRRALQNRGAIALIPVGQIAWLPLATATSAGSSALIDEHTVVTLVNATTRRRSTASDEMEHNGATQQSSRIPRRVRIFVDPGPVDRSLPQVHEEERVIRSCYQPHEIDPVSLPDRAKTGTGTSLRGSGVTPHFRMSMEGEGAPVSADEQRLRLLLDCDIAHLACHCDIDLQVPEKTVIRWGRPFSLGGLRPLISRPRAHLVLSVCDAALTATGLPDEVLSPATAFLLAGARSVCAPLWPVDDYTAPEFMSTYHRRLARGEAPEQALIEAQQTLKGRPSLIWAGWTVTTLADSLSTTRG